MPCRLRLSQPPLFASSRYDSLHRRVFAGALLCDEMAWLSSSKYHQCGKIFNNEAESYIYINHNVIYRTCRQKARGFSPDAMN